MKIPTTLRLPFRGNYPITLGFGEKSPDTIVQSKFTTWGLGGHNGVDFGLPEGTSVLSCDKGKVIHAEIQDDYGLVIMIKHSWGTSLYAHLKELQVHLYQRVRRGQKIGLSGRSGFVTGPHLHFGIRLHQTDELNGYGGYINPFLFLP